jgi:hypothetical protein
MPVVRFGDIALVAGTPIPVDLVMSARWQGVAGKTPWVGVAPLELQRHGSEWALVPSGPRLGGISDTSRFTSDINYGAVRVQTGPDEQAHHLGNYAIFGLRGLDPETGAGIAKAAGVSVIVMGSTKNPGSEHWNFHESENLFDQYRFKTNGTWDRRLGAPSIQEFIDACARGWNQAGKNSSEVEAGRRLMELELKLMGFRLTDPVPNVPTRIPGMNRTKVAPRAVEGPPDPRVLRFWEVDDWEISGRNPAFERTAKAARAVERALNRADADARRAERARAEREARESARRARESAEAAEALQRAREAAEAARLLQERK